MHLSHSRYAVSTPALPSSHSIVQQTRECRDAPHRQRQHYVAAARNILHVPQSLTWEKKCLLPCCRRKALAKNTPNPSSAKSAPMLYNSAVEMMRAKKNCEMAVRT